MPVDIYLDPENTFRIDEMYAYVSVDENGNEGVCAFSSEIGMMPMVGADMERMESMKPIAKDLLKHTLKNIKLIKFTNREDIEIIE